MARPRTRYAKSGDVNIAYQVVGKGPFDLVYVPGWISNVEMTWEEPSCARFFERPARDAAGRIDAGVVEAGDDVAVVAGGLALAHLVDQARHRERLVVVALDAGRPHAGETAVISVPGAATACAAWPIFSVIESVVFGIDDEDAHRGLLRIGPRRAAAVVRPAPARP